METTRALEMAQGQELDLVEVSPNARPPVCRIMDYGKYRYDQAKKARKGRQGRVQLKEIRMKVRISDHDFQFKVGHAERFLKQRHKVRISVVLRGREMAHRELAEELLARVEEGLEHVGAREGSARSEGYRMVLSMAPRAQ